jgi:hypothetical protein
MTCVTCCAALRVWLENAPSLDAALAAAVDLLDRGPDERALAALRDDAADTHLLLGARTLDGLLRLSQTLHS